nr:Sec-independent protein translocase protein TatB [Polymorphobacter sp.]
MFGIDSSELAIVALVALLVIGPKDLPRVMRMVGNWLAKGRAMTRHVRAGFDTMLREAELEEMQKAWADQNDAIMKATALPDLGYANPLVPDVPATDDWMAPPLPLESTDITPAKPRKSRAKPKADTPDGPAKPPRKRTPKAAEPAPTES